MNKKILFVLALNWMLAGCAQAPITDASGPLAGCKKDDPWIYICKGKSNAPAVTLNTKNGELEAKPFCVRANRGSSIEFNLVPPGNKALDTVHIIAKEPKKYPWLKGSNSGHQDRITIKVPEELAHNGKPFYGIKTDTECVDPRIRVAN